MSPSIRRIALATGALSVFLSVPSGVQAQTGAPSVLRFDADYHAAQFGVNVPSSASALLRAFSSRGSVTLRADGSQVARMTTRDVYADPAFDRTGTSSFPGSWFVRPDGRVEFDYGGADFFEWWIAPDGRALLGTRSRSQTDNYLLLAVRKGGGLSAATASGSYRLVQTTLRFDALGGLEGQTVRGDARFDGAGGFRFAGARQSVLADGSSSQAPATFTGSYSVAGDGALSLGALGSGGIAADGEILFAADLGAREVRLTVAVRSASSLDLRSLTGTFAFGLQEVATGRSADRPLAFSANGSADFAARDAATGSYRRESFEVESTPVGTTSGLQSDAGPLAVLAGDTLRIDPGDPEPLDLAVAPSGCYLLGSELFGVTEMFVGMKICGGSRNFGRATAGTAAVPPALGMSTFPTLGNPRFALELADGRGGASAALLFGLAPNVPGLPFLGGRLHVDPAGLLGNIPVSLSGSPGASAAGAASVPFSIPNDPSLGGFELVWQELVIDPGAPAGFAFSDGLITRLCR